MDILIKNIGLPKEPKLLLLGIDEYGNICKVSCERLNFEGLYPFKAIEISDCGCLVNKDDVIACIEKRKDFADKVNDEICVDLCNLLIEDINALPTIVEANDGTDN